MNKRAMTEKASKIKEFFIQFIMPPKCAVCGKLLNINDGTLCVECLEKWHDEKEKECERCTRCASLCTCNAKLNKTAIISYYSSCSMYESEFSKEVIASLKYKRQKCLIKFMANELMSNMYMIYGLKLDNCIIAYPPRSKSSLKKYGFDHAKMLANELGSLTGIPVFHGMRHKGSKEQKYLNYESRAKNAFESFYIKNTAEASEKLRGKTVILIDDVITTGATAICIAAFLHNCGAESVKFLSVAKTPSLSKRNL